MIGYVTMGLAVAPMVAPLIGGILQELFGWTAIYWFMALLGIGCLSVAWAHVPETNLNRTPRLSFASMFRDLSQLLRNSDFLLFTTNCGLTTGVFFAFLGGVPYVAERMLGLSPAIYGLWFASVPIGYAFGNFLSGRFTERFGVARMILAGSVLAFVAATISPLLYFAGSFEPATIFLPLMLTGVANGLSLPSAISGAISVRPDIAGTASGLSGATQIGTGALLSTLAGTLIAGQTTPLRIFAIMTSAALMAMLIAFEIYRRNRR
jgi:DHA1 family bicyclomycin/chloramphenicol resistance-like MFS transporter